MNEKEFEKQQLEQLLNDLKDIDKYTSFKNGAFVYDLGKYQGSLLVNHINNLQTKIGKAIEYINSQKKTISKSQADLFNEGRYNKSKLQVGTFMWNVDELLEILEEEIE